MGGAGSGRLNRTDSFIKKARDENTVKVTNSIVSNDFVLPNLSGIATHPEFLKAKNVLNIVTANPSSADEGALILNSTDNSIYVYYSGAWRLLHALTIGDEFLLLEDGDFILLEIGDKIILE